MKTFEKVKVIFFVLFMMVTGTTFTACGGSDDDEGMFAPSNDVDNSDNVDTQIYELLKRNISASVSYSDYSWIIAIKSNLANTFPGKTIIY